MFQVFTVSHNKHIRIIAKTQELGTDRTLREVLALQCHGLEYPPREHLGLTRAYQG